MNLYEHLRQRVREDPDAAAMIRPGESDVSFGSLDETAGRIAAWLNECGVGTDDRVAVYLPDCPEYVSVLLGVWRAGCVATPVNTRLGPGEVHYVLADVRPAALVVAAEFEDTVGVDDLESLSPETVLTVHPGAWFERAPLSPAAAAPPVERRFDDEPAVVMHTSGSTGRPKGVVQTHRNVAAQIAGGSAKFGLTSADVGLATVPLFHVGGMHEIVLMTLFAGGSVAVQSDWDPVEWARLVEETGATWSGLIPTMMVDVLDSGVARELDTSSLRFCIYGGSPTPEPLLVEFESTVGVGRLVDNYGQTETAGVSITDDVSSDRRPGAMGTPISTVEARVVDLQTGEDVPRGAEGELRLRGDSVTPGYWERDDANEALFTDGWLHTEDLVLEREDGYLAYVGRVDDVILSGGEKVAPSSVERVLQDHSDVTAVSVFGTPHDRLGEAVTAAVVSSDPTLDGGDIEAFCDDSDELAGYEKPRRVVFVDEFPRTGSHKVDKVSLAERALDEFREEQGLERPDDG
ncbi:MAG TPA: AMP-binding protein [Halobacteriales archaeon]|nr:AMP-binding protein [Halobacteriales archaeon]